ncbi:carbon-nitrogen hydrolase family protein [Kordiimonas aquimaris]|uniref:carbon-nitrogen hydrolase family protein n=1 Tax=Kordiimonas aquimaris TaxID=707591 RepID=UPI0021CE87D3|nr:carbon-nitrogen hydrolase family protein [Kordiimonas aquimaris]
MKVTVCELNPGDEARDDNLKRLADHIAKENTDFLLLPEMAFSDWLAADETRNAAKWDAAVDSHTQYIKRLNTLGSKAIVSTRPVTKATGSPRNQAYVWTESTSAVGFHEKVFLPNEPGYWEHNWYDRGSKNFDTAHALGMRIGVQICTEMWFFEWARHYSKAKVDLLCVPRATTHTSLDKWLAGGQAAAICSGAYCLSSNLWRPVGDKANCGGMGWIIDPDGNVLATTNKDNPFTTLEIDLELPKTAKNTYPRYVAESA